MKKIATILVMALIVGLFPVYSQAAKTNPPTLFVWLSNSPIEKDGKLNNEVLNPNLPRKKGGVKYLNIIYYDRNEDSNPEYSTECDITLGSEQVTPELEQTFSGWGIVGKSYKFNLIEEEVMGFTRCKEGSYKAKIKVNKQRNENEEPYEEANCEYAFNVSASNVTETFLEGSTIVENDSEIRLDDDSMAFWVARMGTGLLKVGFGQKALLENIGSNWEKGELFAINKTDIVKISNPISLKNKDLYDTPTEEPTDDPEPTEDPEFTPEPTEEPTDEPTEEPTEEPVETEAKTPSMKITKISGSWKTKKVNIEYKTSNCSEAILKRDTSKSGSFNESLGDVIYINSKGDIVESGTMPDNNVSLGKTYYYKLTTKDKDGKEISSNTVKIKLDPTPTIKSFSAKKKNRVVTVKWSVSHQTKTVIYYKPSGYGWQKVGETKKKKATINVKSSKKASFRIKTYYKYGSKKFYSKYSKTKTLNF